MTTPLTALIETKNVRLGIIGMGYVGLPLAAEFGKTFDTVGFDIDEQRIQELRGGGDHTRELTSEQLQAAERLRLSCDPEDLKDCDIYIVTVPTPIDSAKRPDLTPILSASRTVGKALSPGNLVIYESTVYPGCTEEDCAPILERESGLVFNQDFYCGYSPERINPGDKEHTVTKIIKVVSGSTPEAAEVVDALYSSIVEAGTHRAPSIRVAEAAKIIENCQRDINIAFMNELSMIFNLMGIDTHDVLAAAGTKWNFLNFYPGLVGGHCIGVDPYYLTHKAQQLGHHPQIILAGRRTNDGMGRYVAQQMIKCMIQKGVQVNGARVLVMGVTFKENCPDIRNSRVIDAVEELREFGCNVVIHDPCASPEEVKDAYGLDILATREDLEGQSDTFAAVLLAVAHEEFRSVDFQRFANAGALLYDIRNFLPRELADARL